MNLLPEEQRSLGGGNRARGEEIALEDGAKLELSQPYTGLNSNVPDAIKAQNQLMAQVTCIAAGARLQALTNKIKDTEISAFELPMRAEDWEEYGRLTRWWEAFGVENQKRLTWMIRELADGVEHVARLF